MRFMISVALAACLYSPAFAKPVRHSAQKPMIDAKRHGPDGPECFTAPAAMAAVRQHDGAVSAELQGAAAEALLDRINHTGEPTDWHAQTVIVILHSDSASVSLFNACHEHDVAIRLDAFADIWAAVRGVRV